MGLAWRPPGYVVGSNSTLPQVAHAIPSPLNIGQSPDLTADAYWRKSYYAPDSGAIYCLWDAKDADTVGRVVRACSQIVNPARQTSLSPRSRPAILFRAGFENCFSNDPRGVQRALIERPSSADLVLVSFY
jgi:hypothetical protein